MHPPIATSIRRTDASADTPPAPRLPLRGGHRAFGRQCRTGEAGAPGKLRSWWNPFETTAQTTAEQQTAVQQGGDKTTSSFVLDLKTPRVASRHSTTSWSTGPRPP